jgi:hypothetical protein
MDPGTEDFNAIGDRLLKALPHRHSSPCLFRVPKTLPKSPAEAETSP